MTDSVLTALGSKYKNDFKHFLKSSLLLQEPHGDPSCTSPCSALLHSFEPVNFFRDIVEHIQVLRVMLLPLISLRRLFPP